MLRRGSHFYRSEMAGLISQYQEGDIVKSALVGPGDNFYGIVRHVCSKINKVDVAWGGGAISQHDPDELMPVFGDDDSMENFSRRSNPTTLIGKSKDPEFVGNPKTHGLKEPRGGGFSIMQDLVDDLHKESVKESDKDRYPDGPSASESNDGLKSRRSMYYMGPERQFRLTKNEQSQGEAGCPKCSGNMDLQPFTRSIKLYVCSDCNLKVPTDKVLTERVPQETHTMPDGTEMPGATHEEYEEMYLNSSDETVPTRYAAQTELAPKILKLGKYKFKRTKVDDYSGEEEPEGQAWYQMTGKYPGAIILTVDFGEKNVEVETSPFGEETADEWLEDILTKEGVDFEPGIGKSTKIFRKYFEKPIIDPVVKDLKRQFKGFSITRQY